VSTVEAERNPPVPIDIDRPVPFASSFERVQAKPGSIEISSARRRLEAGKNPPDLWNMRRFQPSCIARFEKSLQSTVSKTDDHLVIVT